MVLLNIDLWGKYMFVTIGIAKNILYYYNKIVCEPPLPPNTKNVKYYNHKSHAPTFQLAYSAVFIALLHFQMPI